MEDLFEEIVKIRKAGGDAALATITVASGSTPRRIGSKMLIRSDGSIVGTVGGGGLEAQVLKEAMKVIKGGAPRLLHFDPTGKEVAEEGMICGGKSAVFVEPITSNPCLYIFGGGHVSFYMAKTAKMVGFRVVVADDRPEFASRERFPDADEIMVDNFSSALQRLRINKNSYIVILTSGHFSDEEVLEWAVKTDAPYIGMIGSKKKKDTIFSHLQSKGISRDVLERVHSPIGLEIDAETPEEIAVSILAEVIKVRRAQKPVERRPGKLNYAN